MTVALPNVNNPSDHYAVGVTLVSRTEYLDSIEEAIGSFVAESEIERRFLLRRVVSKRSLWQKLNRSAVAALPGLLNFPQVL